MFEPQRERLTSFENCFNDIRREKRACKYISDIVSCETALSGERFHVRDLACNNFFVPGVTARNRFYQCSSGMWDRRVRTGRNDEVNFSAVTRPLRFDIQTDQIWWFS